MLYLDIEVYSEGIRIRILLGQLLKSTLFLLLLALLFVLITLMPRNVEYVTEGIVVQEINHSFTWKEYYFNLKNYFSFVVENKSLGNNNDGYPIEIELQRLIGRSLKLIVPAFILSILLGLAKGIFDFRVRKKRISFLGNGTTWLFQSIPDFFLVIAFQYSVFLLIKMGFPKIRIYGFTEWYHLILPIVFMTLFTMMYVARITSSMLSEEEGKDYIRTAISVGVSEKKVVYKHMLKNCLQRLLDYLPSIMLILLTHLLIVEYLFYYKGITGRFIESFLRIMQFRVGQQFPINFPYIIGFILFIAALLIVIEWIKIIGKSLLQANRRGESL